MPEHISCLDSFCFNLLLASGRRMKGLFLQDTWGVSGVCELGTDDKNPMAEHGHRMG